VSPRASGAVKIVGAFVAFAAFAAIIRAFRAEGTNPGTLTIVPVLFVVLAWLGLVEVVTGLPIRRFADSWNRMSSWRQLPFIALLFIAFFGLWALFATLAFP
jgi:hypothetical protein